MSTYESNSDIYDICIIGGGINGCGIARDAAGRGYKTLLLEKNDLASATSSKSTKLIHGGFRYLEQNEIRLVRESLQERNHLIKIAPHIITPLTFILPHEPYIRPYWLIRLGLFLYDVLGFSFTKSPFQKSHGVYLNQSHYGDGLKHKKRLALSYSDGWVDDARLVVANARDAAKYGATIKTYEECLSIKSSNNHWAIQTNKGTYQTKLLVNAAGPWVRDCLDKNQLSHTDTPQVRLVKGSHIVIPKLYDGDHAYILQQPDKRIVFAIPYQHHFTLVGTTEETMDTANSQPTISQNEIDYLLSIINTTFTKQTDQNNIVSHYSGVRALYDDHSTDQRTVTRDYKIIKDMIDKNPIYSIFGGKITTYRALSSHVMKYIDDYFGKIHKDWTLSTPLIGGDIYPNKITEIISKKFPSLDSSVCNRLIQSYGTDSFEILNNNSTEFLVSTILKNEIDFCIKNEFVRTADDYLWRRSKMGLHLSQDEQKIISDYIESKALS